MAQILILRKTERREVASQTAYWTAPLATDKYNSYSPDLKPLRSATAILAISRWALNKSIDQWTRYIVYAGAICDMVDDPPYRPDQRIHDRTAEVSQALATFESWFAREHAMLTAQAKSEQPHFAALAAELGRNID